MKRIGILTYHGADNYGAMLQTYALQKKLQESAPSCDVQVINYLCKEVNGPRTFWECKEWYGLISAIVKWGRMKKFKKICDDFRMRKLNLTQEYEDTESLREDIHNFSVVISGSDQVWNEQWNGGDDVYLQSFHRLNMRKMSYAASFGFIHLPDGLWAKYRDALKQFREISMREETGEKIIRQLGLSARVDIDPTLLLPVEEWKRFAEGAEPERPYLLLYMLKYQKSIVDCAKRIAKERSLRILLISRSIKAPFIRRIGDCKPEEFVGFFRYASYVVTNSFHGTVFSVLFHKKIALEFDATSGKNIRSYELLKQCGVFADSQIPDGIIYFEHIDWETADKHMEENRKDSMEYLLRMVNQ